MMAMSFLEAMAVRATDAVAMRKSKAQPITIATAIKCSGFTKKGVPCCRPLFRDFHTCKQHTVVEPDFCPTTRQERPRLVRNRFVPFTPSPSFYRRIDAPSTRFRVGCNVDGLVHAIPFDTPSGIELIKLTHFIELNFEGPKRSHDALGTESCARYQLENFALLVAAGSQPPCHRLGISHVAGNARRGRQPSQGTQGRSQAA